jgi:hypothetical protein
MAQQHRIDPRYIGEQVGPNERRLKEKLAAAFLEQRVVDRAYLVHADLGDGGRHNVILALVAPGCDRAAVVQQVGRAFESIFDHSQHLDILFVDPHDGHEALLRRTSPPFFDRGGHVMLRLD